jgi:hypothetical protein
MSALRFLDIEADVFDPFREVEIQHFLRCIHSLLRQNRDNMERNLLSTQQANGLDCSIERAAL